MKLALQNINKTFGNNHVLKDLSFTVDSGQAFGLLGRNGSGKTTTIRIIMEIFQADSGNITLDGKKISKKDIKIGYLPEERGLYPKRLVSEQMVYLGQLRGMSAKDARNRSEALLEELEAGEYFKKRLDTLSKGNQQKIQLAISLLNDPDIIILDEPFSGLDPVNAHLLKQKVASLVHNGKMVLFSSHQMSSVESICDHICIINKGKIVLDGQLRDIKRSYPRNKIFLVPENGTPSSFANTLMANSDTTQWIASVEPLKNGCAITLKDAGLKNELLQSLVNNNILLDTYQIIEPTLEEIFVEKAGDSHEAV